MPEKPGFHEGLHYTEYVEQVNVLKKEKRFAEAEKLLLELVNATEAEDSVEQFGVAPWYYEQLAIIYRGRKDITSECSILERYETQRHAPGVKPAALAARLAKAKNLLQSGE